MTDTISFHAAGRVGVLKIPHILVTIIIISMYIGRHTLLVMRHRENCTFFIRIMRIILSSKYVSC